MSRQKKWSSCAFSMAARDYKSTVVRRKNEDAGAERHLHLLFCEKGGGKIDTRKRITIRLPQDVYRDILDNLGNAASSTFNSFMTNAARFYLGYIKARETEDYLSKTLLSIISARQERSDKATVSVLYALAVELNILQRILSRTLTYRMRYMRSCAGMRARKLRSAAKARRSNPCRRRCSAVIPDGKARHKMALSEAGRARHAQAYIRYIATREGVEKYVEENGARPAAQAQRVLDGKLLRDFRMRAGALSMRTMRAGRLSATRRNSSRGPWRNIWNCLTRAPTMFRTSRSVRASSAAAHTACSHRRKMRRI